MITPKAAILKINFLYITFLSFLFISVSLQSQTTESSKSNDGITKLFRSNEIIPIKLSFSNKNVRNNTNDSTYIKTDLIYKETMNATSWDTIKIKLRARGNFRRANCYFPPIKVKIKKKAYKNTLFNKNKTLKFVLPCLLEKSNNDNIVREYMAYQLFEIISPYHFKTRLTNIDFTQIKRKKTIERQLKGIIIEDDKRVAKRHDGKVYKRSIHPMNLDHLTSIRNDLFQYMIGNTDFSSGYQHNGKLIFINKKMMPIPYDFDMSGLVNASYSTVSKIQNQELEITEVTDRVYRGFKRDEGLLQKVRLEFIDNKSKILETIDRLEPYFEDPKKFKNSRNYILEFFEIIINDQSFKAKISNRGRTDK